MSGGTDMPLAGVAQLVGWSAFAIEMFAIGILLIGMARFAFRFAGAELSHAAAARRDGLDAGRLDLGRYILTGLEVLIVADVIHTALSLEIMDIAFLGGLVVVRTVISYFLTREIHELETEQVWQREDRR